MGVAIPTVLARATFAAVTVARLPLAWLALAFGRGTTAVGC